MTPKEINEAIAAHLGWVRLHDAKELPGGAKVEIESWVDPGGVFKDVPDYCGDLNAMHGAEHVMRSGDWTRYVQWLANLARGTHRFVVAHAAALQRAEAFLRTVGKWEEA